MNESKHTHLRCADPRLWVLVHNIIHNKNQI